MYDVCHGKAYNNLLIPANSHLHCNGRHHIPSCRNMLWLLVVHRTVSGLVLSVVVMWLLKSQCFWVVMQCSVDKFHLHPEDGRSRFFQNVFTCLPEYRASHARQP